MTHTATTSAAPTTVSPATATNRNAGVSPAGPAKPALSAVEGSSLPAVTKPQPATTSAAPTTTTTAAPSIATKSTPKSSTAPPHVAAATPPKVAARPAPVSSTTHLERTANGATITNSTNSSAPTPSTDATRAKYDGMAGDFAAQQGGKYTLQFELVCETSSVTRALNEGGGKVWFVRTSYRNRPCYRVFWGRFDSSAEASAASKELPASLGSAPVAVKIPR